MIGNIRNIPLLLIFATIATVFCHLAQAQGTDSTRHAQRILVIDKVVPNDAIQAAQQGARFAKEHLCASSMLTAEEAEMHRAVPMRHMRMEHGPYFPGGTDSLTAYMHRQLHYPECARNQQLQGEVYVYFTVDTLGAIGNVRGFRDIGGGCLDEAVRVVTHMPYWVPARNLAGRRVMVETIIPIKFSLDNTVPAEVNLDPEYVDDEHFRIVDTQDR